MNFKFWDKIIKRKKTSPQAPEPVEINIGDIIRDLKFRVLFEKNSLWVKRPLNIHEQAFFFERGFSVQNCNKFWIECDGVYHIIRWDMKMKIKAWDHIMKKMFVPTRFNPSNGYVLHTHEFGQTWLAPEFFDILLSTGEKTKDGEELYQGDIVKLYHKGDWVICHIVFHKAAFRLQWPDGYINGMPINSNKYIKLGNIYEHPHLIQK